MPLAESIKTRSEPRDARFDQVQSGYKPFSGGFDLSKEYFVVHHVPLKEESGFKYIKQQGDRMVHAMLDTLITHRLKRMVSSAIQSFDADIEELATNEETERFALHLVGQKTVLVSEQMFGAFSTLLREERLRYPHGYKELAGYIVRRFNEDRPLTTRVVAIEESGKVVIMPARAFESADDAN